MFEKYIHLERYGTDAVDEINVGKCYILPKLDGTNGRIQWDTEAEIMRYGSRNRDLALGDDNAGFALHVSQNNNLQNLCKTYKGYTFYGEWLVPHSLKTYREDAWRKFYIFDVVDPRGNFLHYDQYSVMLKNFNVEFIPCVATITNPSYEQLVTETEKNKYLLQENSGHGEGIVIKRYDFTNSFGHTVWAKLITNTFKDKHVAEMGGSVIVNKMIEEEIANEFVTEHVVNKVLEKIRNEHGLFSAKNIPQLLNTVYHDLITEEMWEILKKHKNPRIDFRTLNTLTITRVKAILPELFGGK
jgi:hypothetical protein